MTAKHQTRKLVAQQNLLSIKGCITMLLEIKSVSKSYGKNKALDNFSLTLTNGVYGLLGPNGAGKSTLISIITGLIFPDSGIVKYTDSENNILGNTLGFLPQYQSFYSNFTAEEMLLYMMCLKDFNTQNPKKYVMELLEQVNLQDSCRKKIRTFSGGMKQRLGIAQALIGNPNVIIFDEPTAGLDPKERIRFRNIISSLGKDKIIILSTHIVTDVAYVAKVIILIDKGKLIYAEPQNKIIQKVLGKVWSYKCNENDVISIMNNYKVSNVLADEEGFILRIISDKKPFKTAVSATPNLDDVCLYCFGEV